MRKIIIDANKNQFGFVFRELFDYKDLFWLLAYKDFRVRYAQTFLGLTWAFIQPLLTLLILTLVFGRIAKIDTQDVPYPLFAICGITMWSYFSFVLSQSGGSIIAAQEMIKKVYFPRLLIPLSKSVTGIIDLLVGIIFIVALAFYYQYRPGENIIFLPIFILLGIISSLGLGLWVSALSLKYRDFQHIVPFIVQFGLYISPIAYPSTEIIDKVPKWLAYAYFLNPMSGIVEGIRWSILGTVFPWELSLISIGVTIITFLSGILYFLHVENIMSDIV